MNLIKYYLCIILGGLVGAIIVTLVTGSILVGPIVGFIMGWFSVMGWQEEHKQHYGKEGIR